ncbi:hypothetical protein PAEPH01_2161 [Pancytospora epiphaga]|nr:hypothetical protein PAEPH01_2161 [Pancytospora epiphaga]
MTTVLVYDREGNIKLKMRVFEGENIFDIRRRLPIDGLDAPFVSYRGVPLSDSVELSALGETVVLQVDRDIEFIEIDTNLKEKKNEGDSGVVLQETNNGGCSEELLESENIDCIKAECFDGIAEDRTNSTVVENRMDERTSDIGLKIDDSNSTFTLEGKRYVIVNRRKRVTLNLIAELLRNLVTRENVARLAIGLFLFTSNNLFVLLMLLVFNAMIILDNFLVKRREVVRKLTNVVSKAIFMFFASLLFIDHPRYFD